MKNNGRFFDIVFVVLAFGVYALMLNLDKNLETCNIICRHFWMPLIIAYYIGRLVSIIHGRRKA
jgi:hypothetical protein